MDDQDDSWNESVHSCNFLAIATNMIKFNCVIHGEERDKCNFQILNSWHRGSSLLHWKPSIRLWNCVPITRTIISAHGITCRTIIVYYPIASPGWCNWGEPENAP